MTKEPQQGSGRSSSDTPPEKTEPRFLDFGNRLTFRMQQQGISTAEMAKQAEVTFAGVRKWMKGFAMPRPETRPLIAQILDSPYGDLYGDEVPMFTDLPTKKLTQDKPTASKLQQLAELEGQLRYIQSRITVLRAELMDEWKAPDS